MKRFKVYCLSLILLPLLIIIGNFFIVPNLLDKIAMNQRERATLEIVECINASEPRVTAIGARIYRSSLSDRAVAIDFVFQPSKEDGRTQTSKRLAVDAEFTHLSKCLLASPFQWYTLNMITLQYTPTPYVDRTEIGFIAKVNILFMFGRKEAEELLKAPSFSTRWDEMKESKQNVFMSAPPILTFVQTNRVGFNRDGWNKAVEQWKAVKGIE